MRFMMIALQTNCSFGAFTAFAPLPGITFGQSVNVANLPRPRRVRRASSCS
jgi:hypothetical protein